MSISRFCMLILSLMTLGSYCVAQQYLQDDGLPVYSITESIPMGSINIANGNLHLEFVLWNAPQRGSASVDAAYKIIYDSKIWGSPTGSPGPASGGWRYLGAKGDVANSGNIIQCLNGPQLPTKFTYTTKDGTRHPFDGVVVNPYTTTGTSCGTIGTVPPTSVLDAFATDNSGYRLHFVAVPDVNFPGLYYTEVFNPDGTRVSLGSAYAGSTDNSGFGEDANGNYLYQIPPTDIFSDTLGRHPISPSRVTCADGSSNCFAVDVSIAQGASASGPGTARYIAQTAPATANVSFSGTTNPYQLVYNYPTASNSTNQAGPITVLTLPDGTAYHFTYNSAGELASMSLPTGGTWTFGYSDYTDAYGNINRWLTSRSDGTNQWTYTPSVITTCPHGGQNCQQKVTELKPTGESTVYTYTLNGNAWLSLVQVYDTAGVLQQTTANDYDFTGTCALCTGAINVVMVRSTVTLPVTGGSLSKKTEYGYDTSVANYKRLNVIKEWGYYSGQAPASPVKETDIAFVPPSNFAHQAANKIASITIKNSSGTQLAQTLNSYDTSSVTLVPGVFQHDESVNNVTTRGNLTQIQRWVSGTTFLTTTVAYDSTGQIISVTDPASNKVTYGYSDNFYVQTNSTAPTQMSPVPGVTNAYATTVGFPGAGNISVGYYYGTGQAALGTDQNGATNSLFYDSMGRPTLRLSPGGGWMLNAYNSPTVIDTYLGITDAAAATSCQGCMHTRSTIDSLGRPIQDSIVNDPDGQVYSDVTYDGLGRKASTSNPYRNQSESTYGTSTSTFDALGRLTTALLPGGSKNQVLPGPAAGSVAQLCSTATYGIGYPVLRIDAAGKKNLFWYDGLNRLIEVDEPNSSNVLNVNTCYAYDPLGNLLSVVQQGETRSYAYDGLSRLTSFTIPESGSTSLTYATSTGALCSGNIQAVCLRTDAKGITTTYTYDSLGRLTQRTYSDGSPSIGFDYDQASVWGLTLNNTKGRLSHEWTATGQRVFSYDAAGRIVDQWECLPSNCGVSNYHTKVSYDLAGNIAQVTYPSGRTVTTTNNNAMNATQVALTAAGGQSLNYLYAGSAHYGPSGALSSVIINAYPLGNNTNALTESYSYNNRFQMIDASIASSVLTASHVSYSYLDASGNNNGNVSAITDMLSSSRNQSFSYDQLNRLSNATETAWGLNFGYDGYGNLLTQSVSLGSAPSLTVAVDSHNRITTGGLTYDSAGNMTADGSGKTYQFDPEARLKTITQTGSTVATYSYDVNNTRVTRQVGGITTEYIVFGSQLLAQHSSTNWNDWTDFIYLGGRRLAQSDSFENRIHIHGTNCSNCGSQYSLFALSGAGGYSGQQIRSGDTLFLQQLQSSGAHGGIEIAFSDGSSTNWTATDQDGQQANNDSTQNAWHNRRINLTSFAGKTISQIYFLQESTTAAGTWDISFNDVSLVSTDGTVRPIYSRQGSISLSASGTSGVTGRTYEVLHVSGESQLPDVTTRFFHSDQLSSSRMVSSRYGYPLWKATYLPFGEEYNPQLQTTEFKFAGYQRDSESNLDYAKERYYSSQFKRFITPDVHAGDLSSPQSLNRYSYVGNNPLNFIDPTGMDSCDITDSSAFCDITFTTPGGGSGSIWWDGSSDDGGDDDPGIWWFPPIPIYIVPPTLSGGAGGGCCSSVGVPSTPPPATLYTPNYGNSYEAYLQDMATNHKDDEPLNRSAYELIYGNKTLWEQSSMTVDKIFEATVVVSGGALLSTAWIELPTMTIAVGPGESPSFFHVAYESEGAWAHAVGDGLGDMEVELGKRAMAFNRMAWFRFTVPVLHPEAVIPAAGSAAFSCATSAFCGFFRGWGF